MIISLLLLLLCVLDAAGDAFRVRKWQIIHHSLEVVQIAVWFLIWALFEFRYEYVIMYITGRIFLFDIVFNLIARNKWSYVGTSSLYGRILGWFAGVMKEPGHLVWVIRAIAIIWWIAWLITIK